MAAPFARTSKRAAGDPAIRCTVTRRGIGLAARGRYRSVLPVVGDDAINLRSGGRIGPALGGMRGFRFQWANRVRPRGLFNGGPPDQSNGYPRRHCAGLVPRIAAFCRWARRDFACQRAHVR